MFFLQATQAPVSVRWGEKTLIIPKFLLRDFITWGSLVKNEYITTVSEGMEEDKKREFLAMYPPIEPDLNELRKRIRSPGGIEFVLTTCLRKPEVQVLDKDRKPLPALTDPERIAIVELNSAVRSYQLVFALVDMDDRLEQDPTPAAPAERGADPFANTGKDGSVVSPGTGSETSPSSAPPTPAPTPSTAP